MPFYEEIYRCHISCNQQTLPTQRLLKLPDKKCCILNQLPKCSLQYVGQTGNTIINERILGHLTDIRAENNFKPVSRHFTSNNHTVNDVNVTVITTPSQTTNIRLRKEEAWIVLLQTREPGGLNLIQ